ncbi:MAG: hypothetical protein NVSMB2_24340 [Chloroflexota bacterium]
MLSHTARPLVRLGIAMFFAQSAFAVYGAALPLYFSGLGLDPTAIGLLVGTVGIAELVGALAVGTAIDRFGGRAVLLAGAILYVFAATGYLAFSHVPALAVLRLVQGLGLAAVIPAAYSFVPHLVRSRRQTVAFASLGAGNNVAMAICPPLGLVLLQSLGPPALFVSSAIAAVLGGLATVGVSAPKPSRRPLGLVFRRVWLLPLLVAIFCVVQWGVIQAFVPLEAERLGSNPGLLFAADAVSVLALRIPAGWVADRAGPFRLALVGVIVMTLSPLVLLLPNTDDVLVVAGVLNGGGAGLTLPPMLAQLSRRSDEETRGTGLAYFSVAFALGMIIGASGGGLLYQAVGYSGLLRLGALFCCAAVLVLLRDRAAMQVGTQTVLGAAPARSG